MWLVCRNRSHELSSSPISVLRHLFSTTSRPPEPTNQYHPVVDYLVDSLGFSTKEAISASLMVSHLKSSKNPDLVVNVLKKYGLEPTHIRNVVSSVPTILSGSIDGNLEPKLKFFHHNLGLSGSDLAKLIKVSSGHCGKGLNTHIKPTVTYLLKLLRNTENVVKVVKRLPRLLHSVGTSKYLPPNVLALQSFNFSNDDIVKFVMQHPMTAMRHTEVLEDAMQRVEGELGIPRHSGMFLNVIHVLGSVSKSDLEIKFGVFRSFGWSDSDIYTMARRQPLCLAISEAKARKVLNFFMKELGYTPSYLASHPILLMSGFEKRVKPRHQIMNILKEKKLNCNASLYTAVRLPESKFVETYVLRYKDVLPNLHKTYTDTMKQ